MFSRAISRLLIQQSERMIKLPKPSPLFPRTVHISKQGLFSRTFCMPICSAQALITRSRFSATTLHSNYALLMYRISAITYLRRMASSLPTKRKYTPTSPVTWLSSVVVLSLGAALVWYVRITRQEQEEKREREKKRSVGMPAIGGPFQLIDQDGKEVTQDDFLGKWVLIYFGFCHCPDICPDQLDKQAAIIDKVDARLEGRDCEPLQPLFISVDPKRDDAAAVKEYIEEFHPRLIGLTGTVEEVKSACKAFRIYFSSGPADQDDDYIVDHSVVMYLLDSEGNFVTYFGQDKKVRDIVNDIAFKMQGFI